MSRFENSESGGIHIMYIWHLLYLKVYYIEMINMNMISGNTNPIVTLLMQSQCYVRVFKGML